MNINLRNQVSEFIYEDKSAEVFIKIMERYFSEISDTIDKFPEVVHISSVVDIFLPKLSEILKYEYDHSISEDDQREIIKRLLEIYRKRGTDDSIIMAATYGDNNDWIGDHIFLPDADKSRSKATIDYSYNQLFTHNKSTFSGSDKYPDAAIYRNGILIVNLTYLNDEIRDAIKKVVPAGIKIRFNNKSDMLGNGEYGEVEFGEWKLSNYYSIDYLLSIKDREHDINIFSMSVPGRKLRSGRRLVYDDYEIQINKDVHNQDNFKILKDIDGRVSYKGLPKRSTFSAIRSGKYSQSGTYTGELVNNIKCRGLDVDIPYLIDRVLDTQVLEFEFFHTDANVEIIKD